MAMEIYHWATGNQIKNLEKDLNLMRNKAESLLARAADISTEVTNEELHPGKKRKREVDNWMQNAQELHNRFERIEEEVEQGEWPNHHKLRDEILQIIKEIEELLQQATFQNGLVIQDIASSSLPLVTTDMKGQQFDSNLRLILSWLKADKVSKIGVYGQGGVGKTTLATHIHNQLLRDVGERASFCWVTVSKDCTISKLQDKIVKALGQPKLLEEEDEMKRPGILSEALKKRGNVVVILDDMWNHFPLEKVGLPTGENGCKLLLTTRSWDVCRRMECQESVKVESLSEEESWSLFVEKLGNYDKLSLEAKATAKLVAKECAGLPLGIKVVAASMRGVFDDYEWNNTLEELQNPTRIHQGMENEVFPSLQLSYFRLNDVMLQKCFLSCALYPEDSELERLELVNHWIMEGHLEGIQSRQKQLDKAYSMINRLVSACLLDAVRLDFVKMHDLIRDMAIRISSQRDHVMIKAGIGLQEVPRPQEWTKELTKVSLIGNSISNIPAGMRPICPNLSCLFFEGNPLVTIPDSFLMCFNGLKFLDLSRTSIESVPNSVSDLENLSALNLADCHELLSVPSLAKLGKLRHLNLRSCWKINYLPKGMEKLVNLECLCLDGCRAFRPVTFNQLTLGLFNIQCLELGDCVVDAQITDIQKLRFLERLAGCKIHDSIGNFNKYVRSQHFLQLTSYHLLLRRTYFRSLNSNRAITFDRIKFEGEAEPVQLPHNIQELEVLFCDFKVRSLADALPSLDGLTSLKVLRICFCELIECIWSVSSYSKPTLDILDKLMLIELKSLRGLAIGRVELPRGAFSSLRTLYMDSCNRVEKLFTPCLLNGQLRNLEGIAVSKCDVLDEIFELDDESGDATVEINTINTIISLELPKLRVLHLSNLPRLVSICKTGLLCCNSIEEIKVRWCPQLKKLPITIVDEELGNGELLTIQADSEWWESLVWDNPHNKHLQDRAAFIPFEDDSDEQITDIQKLGSLERLKGRQIHGINNFNKYVRSQHLNDVKMHDLIRDTAIMEEIKDYFSIFYLVPTDYEFEEDTLIQLWMAKECIKDESQGQTRFHSLLNGQFLLQSGTNFVTRKARYRMNTKKMNDLLDGQRDMYGRFYLKWEDESQKNITNSTEMQHVSLVCNDIDASVFQTLQQFTKLRTLLFLRNYGNKVTQVPDRLFLSCQKLQALDLSRTHIKKLSSFVANLIHLRFLDLSWTLIEWLPDTICSLNELQTLKLKGCVKLRGLPRQLKKLTKLRHLDVDVLRQLATLPGGIGALVSLRTLSAFLVGTEDGCKIQELRDLNNLTGDFCISMLENVGNGDEANEAAVINKQYINKLELRVISSLLLSLP